MLRTLDCVSWSRFLGPAAVLALLGACSAPRERPLGYVEVHVAGVCDSARSGQLRLEGGATAVVSGGELCLGSVVRELPEGSYRLSWAGGENDDGLSLPAELRGPALLSVLAGRRTLLRLTVEEAAASPALDPAVSAGDPSDAACSYFSAREGPS
jgi:hypothetical protein